MQAAVLKSLLIAGAFLFSAGATRAQASPQERQSEGAGGAATDETALRKRIAGLEDELRKLQEENAALKRQLELSGEKAPAGKEPAVTGTEMPAKLLPEGTKWISSTGKRHNPGCRYYGKGGGRAGKPGEGVACKMCGG